MPVSAVITLVVGILFAISQMTGLNKDSKMVIKIKAPKIDVPASSASANTPALELAPAPINESAPRSVSELANNLLKDEFVLCHSGKCNNAKNAIEYLDEAIKLQLA